MKRLRNVPWVSGMLVVINVIVFLMCTFSGNVLYNKGELDVVSVLAGKQYGRLLWAMFLHAGIEHIFNNMVLLFFLGAMIEKVTGHVTFLVLYFLSGIGGNLCSLLVKLLQMDYSASVGASGAIFGLDGVLLAWILLDRQSMPDVTPKRVILMIALSLYSGFTAQNIDNAAHVGGLVTGFLAGLLFCALRKHIDDPTIYVINKMQEVLEELRVHVERYNLYDGKTNITTLPQTLKEADGIILATTVEWYGIGGYMQQFLDACWLYGDKETITGIYMCPVVMSTTYGEREGKLSLAAAWEILGGLPCSGICGYIENTVTLEMNGQYGQIIEKKAENMYRTINQKIASFPASNKVMRQKVTIPKAINLTPQETEQLSEYVSDDTFVQRQKEDIQELTSMFRDMLDNSGTDNEQEYLEELRKVFVPQPGFEARYVINIEEKKNPLWIAIGSGALECGYGETEKPDVEMQMNRAAMEDIVNGRMTFQRAFMSGIMKRMKGDFRILRTLDQMFPFEENNR